MSGTNLLKGMVGGFVGTIVLSAIMTIKTMMGIMPQFDMIGMPASMVAGSRAVAWVVHFLIGTVLWGGLFAWLDPSLPTHSPWFKGALFGIGAWLLMMVTMMPMAGAGLFAAKLGVMVTIVTFVLHAIFGGVMGAVYEWQNPASRDVLSTTTLSSDLRNRAAAERRAEGLRPAA